MSSLLACDVSSCSADYQAKPEVMVKNCAPEKALKDCLWGTKDQIEEILRLRQSKAFSRYAKAKAALESNPRCSDVYYPNRCQLTDPHVALALGDESVDGVQLLDQLVLEQLVYKPETQSISDKSKHTGDLISLLIRKTNADWERGFEVLMADGERTQLSLRSIVKAFLRNLPAPSIVRTGEVLEEYRPDEWVVLVLAYAQEDEELKAFIEGENLEYNHYVYDPTELVPGYVRTGNVTDYLAGAQLEHDEAQSGDERATCHGKHAQEALLVHSVLTGDFAAAEPVRTQVFAQMKALNEQELTVETASDLAHHLDALSQVAGKLELSQHELDTLKKSLRHLSTFIEENSLDAELSTGLLGHSHLALNDLLAFLAEQK